VSPDTVTLRERPRAILGTLWPTCLLVLALISNAWANGGYATWGAALFFLFCALVAGVVAVRLKRPSELTIDDQGVRMTAPFGPGFSYAWRNVVEIGLAKPRGLLGRGNPMKEAIGINFQPGAGPQNRAARMNRSLYGYEVVIPNWWDVSTEALLERIEARFEAHQAASAAESGTR
jgi:hypothetical protein